MLTWIKAGGEADSILPAGSFVTATQRYGFHFEILPVGVVSRKKVYSLNLFRGKRRPLHIDGDFAGASGIEEAKTAAARFVANLLHSVPTSEENMNLPNVAEEPLEKEAATLYERTIKMFPNS